MPPLPISPDTTVNIIFGVLEVVIGFATAIVAIASYLLARKNTRHMSDKVRGLGGDSFDRAVAYHDRRPVHGGVKKPRDTPHSSRHHEFRAAGSV
ncbi:MAG: hypothetical protein M1836_003896 [Candelina mexicana]|nr:MAG: hypothetical protein M1836_003896 [Candelina mexicana]